MFKIGEFSKFTKVSVRMLRHYDDVGLLQPCKIDDITGYRFYSASQIPLVSKIVTLRDLGFKISEIEYFLSLEDEKMQKDMLEEKRGEINKVIESQISKLNEIDSLINDFDKEKANMNYNVKIKEIPSHNVISYRDIIPAYNAEGMLWGHLTESIEKNNIKCKDGGYTVYHDAECKESDVDVEVVMEVANLGESEGKYIFKQTPKVDKAATILISGDYSNIAGGFAYLAKWIEENNYEICGLFRQQLIRGPWNESNPNEYITEIQVPVR